MVTDERDDLDETEWPAAPDPINATLLPLIEHIFAATTDGSAARAAAMSEVLAAAERVKQALAPKPRLN